ncbi:Putative peroxiredoxin [Urbifossiella limnaea]|uniref:Peroxiredoxin n=1 Tax=Urbifossiella limnaea TaxID=2528023 RepID=A0A517XU43_9BACT|nr:Putative peroxiredoxin [Urbifossiella limnaea]
MQKDLATIEAAGVKVVGVSYDAVAVLKGFADKQKITFPLLSDPDSKTIAAYALRNKETAGKKFGKADLDGVPYPGTILVGTDGVVKAKLFVDGYRERHGTAELVKAAEGLKKK